MTLRKRQKTLKLGTSRILLKPSLWRSFDISNTSSLTSIDWLFTCSIQQTSRRSSATSSLRKLSMSKWSLLSLLSRTNTFVHAFSYLWMDAALLISQSRSLQDMVSCYLRKVALTKAAAALVLIHLPLTKHIAGPLPKRENLRAQETTTTDQHETNPRQDPLRRQASKHRKASVLVVINSILCWLELCIEAMHMLSVYIVHMSLFRTMSESMPREFTWNTEGRPLNKI